VQTPIQVAEKMIQLADLKAGQKHFDIGAGDGRLVTMAAQETGSSSIGVEIEEELVQRARLEIERLKLEDRASIIHDDFLNVDLSEADVVTVYLSPTGNERLRPKLERELKKGARVISHDFEISDWKPSEVLKTYVMFRSRAISPGDPIIDSSTMRLHTIYLYKIGEPL
jgi:cyclopropane fatty-acyl-phospholipid synthase-like methyltransferase